MDYIINPMWVYWIHVIDTLKWICLGLSVCSGIGIGIALICYFENIGYGADDQDVLASKKAFRFLIPIFCISLIISIFAPSETTMLKMLIAKIATKSNVDMTVESIKSVVDYIVESIQKIK